jgi:hypothetical protein
LATLTSSDFTMPSSGRGTYVGRTSIVEARA